MKTKSSFIDTPGRGVRSESMSLTGLGRSNTIATAMLLTLGDLVCSLRCDWLDQFFFHQITSPCLHSLICDLHSLILIHHVSRLVDPPTHPHTTQDVKENVIHFVASLMISMHSIA